MPEKFDRVQKVTVKFTKNGKEADYYIGWIGNAYPSREEVYDRLKAKFPRIAEGELHDLILDGKYKETFLDII